MRSNIPAGAVVVGIDGSEHSDQALAWAAEEATLERRPLVILHAAGEALVLRQSPWSTLEGADLRRFHAALMHAAHRVLDQAAGTVRGTHVDLEVTTALEELDPRQALVEASASAEIVVLGSRGRGPLQSLLGSVSTHVAKHATSPVVVCRPRITGVARTGITVGVDGTPTDQAALAQAFRLASTRGLPLTVMHCYWDAPAGDTSTEDLRLLVAEAVAGWREAWPDVHVDIDTARGLVDTVLADRGATTDMVVVGRPHSGSLTRLIHGYTAIAVLERSRTTVVVAPAPPT
jgi:nucleotide-binding universal stress UspA family protein